MLDVMYIIIPKEEFKLRNTDTELESAFVAHSSLPVPLSASGMEHATGSANCQ
jgi:hypothetical protein